jgi:hypothetical protein
VIQVSTQLAIMVETGVTLSEALDCISAQADKPKLKKLLADSARRSTAAAISAPRWPSTLSRSPCFSSPDQGQRESGQMPKMLIARPRTCATRPTSCARSRAPDVPGDHVRLRRTTTLALLIFVLPRFTRSTQQAAALPLPTKIRWPSATR